jgi:hypothetical protein
MSENFGQTLKNGDRDVLDFLDHTDGFVIEPHLTVESQPSFVACKNIERNSRVAHLASPLFGLVYE